MTGQLYTRAHDPIVKWLILLIVGLLGWLCIGRSTVDTLAGQNRAGDDHGILRASRIELIDNRGNVRAVLEQTPDGEARLAIIGQDNSEAVSLDSRRLQIASRNGRTRAAIEITDGWPQLSLVRDGADHSAYLDSESLTLCGQRDALASLSVKGGVGRVHARGAEKAASIVIEAGDSASPRIRLHRKNTGSLSLSAPSDDPISLSMQRASDGGYIHLGLTPDGGCNLDLCGGGKKASRIEMAASGTEWMGLNFGLKRSGTPRAVIGNWLSKELKAPDHWIRLFDTRGQPTWQSP